MIRNCLPNIEKKTIKIELDIIIYSISFNVLSANVILSYYHHHHHRQVASNLQSLLIVESITKWINCDQHSASMTYYVRMQHHRHRRRPHPPNRRHAQLTTKLVITLLHQRHRSTVIRWAHRLAMHTVSHTNRIPWCQRLSILPNQTSTCRALGRLSQQIPIWTMQMH